MYKIFGKSTFKLRSRWKTLTTCHHYSRDIAATYQAKQLETSVAEVNDRTNVRLFNGPIRSDVDAKRYTSILPPPNVTGNLHLGHAMMATVQDVICRWKLLNGYDVQWIPGIDHAGIATQVVVEKSLKKEKNVTRHDIGKKAFVEEILKWKEKKGQLIKDDLVRMGSIFNWEKEYFTMDQNLSEAVVEAYIRLFDANLIYRDEAMINWSCSLESAVSDIEVESIDIDGPTKIIVPNHARPVTFGEIYDIVYRSMDDDGSEIVVATTRPETLLGDVAIAVHPDDQRYLHLRNTEFWHPFRNEPIPLVFDEFVDPKMGTGAVKITPAHNKEDFAVAKRHRLPFISVFDKSGVVLDSFELFAGEPRFDTREKIVDALAEDGLFRGKSAHKMKLPRCSRSQDVIEYFVKCQWFLRCHDMMQASIDAVDQKKLTIDPPKFEKEWKHWLSDSRDWCLSRQLWWGHRIPAYECIYNDRIEWIVARSGAEAREKAKNLFGVSDSVAIQIRQDDDVLDTWFSSGLLPFTLFGWPDEKAWPNTKTNYPLDILVTGNDILFFWVARMTMLSTQLTNELPFKKILLHGIICDANGRKMSKSRGNIVTPSQIIKGAKYDELIQELKNAHREGILSDAELKISIEEKRQTFPKGIPACGTDALRFTLCANDIRDNYISFSATTCHNNSKFFNKIWNATRYTLDNCEKFAIDPLASAALSNDDALSDFDNWILSRLAHTLSQTRTAMDNFDFHLVTAAWLQFSYENLCDVYLESTKLDFWQYRTPAARVHCEVLKICLAVGLKQMGVFTPFLSNELLKHLPLAVEFSIEDWMNESLEEDIGTLMDLCATIRQLKQANKILKKHVPRTYISTNDNQLLTLVRKHCEIVNLTTFSAETFVTNDFEQSAKGFITQSTAAQLCTFGITVDTTPSEVEHGAVTNAFNRKKLENLMEELVNHHKHVEHFRKNDRRVPAKLCKQIENSEFELEKLKQFTKS